MQVLSGASHELSLYSYLNTMNMLICASDKTKLQELEDAFEDAKRAWGSEKDGLLKIQNEYEDQKRAWEAEKDHLLKKQHDLETKLHQGKETFRFPLNIINDTSRNI